VAAEKNHSLLFYVFSTSALVSIAPMMTPTSGPRNVHSMTSADARKDSFMFSGIFHDHFAE
jgi:hypothetical protein